jgi:hypothetical protein
MILLILLIETASTEAIQKETAGTYFTEITPLAGKA